MVENDKDLQPYHGVYRITAGLSNDGAILELADVPSTGSHLPKRRAVWGFVLFCPPFASTMPLKRTNLGRKVLYSSRLHGWEDAEVLTRVLTQSCASLFCFSSQKKSFSKPAQTTWDYHCKGVLHLHESCQSPGNRPSVHQTTWCHRIATPLFLWLGH